MQHADGIGFNLELKAFPRDGKLVVLPPRTDDRAGAGGANPTPTTGNKTSVR